MAQRHTYFSPTTPGNASWSEVLGTTGTGNAENAIRLGTEDGFIDEAELGSVGISNVVLDDPAADIGHAADGIVGLKQWYVDELACSAGDQRLWTGYIGRRRYRRGSAQRASLITGPAREIDVELVDTNSFLSFRKFKPTAVDSTSDFVRPAETDIARVGALLTTVDFLSTTLYDLGNIDTTGGVAMDACDYSDKTPADVLNDCAQQSGRNFHVKYNEANNKLELFYQFNVNAPAAAIGFTNVLSEVDNSTTFAVEPDAELERDPSRIVSWIDLPYDGGTAYRSETDAGVTTSYTYAWRDSSAPSSNVKTLAKANARADRYLIDNSTEDDRVTWTAHLPAAYVNGAKAGQITQCHFSHLPGLSAAARSVYILQRNVMQREETPDWYEVSYEGSPLSCTSGDGATPAGYYRPLGTRDDFTVPSNLLDPPAYPWIFNYRSATYADDPNAGPRCGDWPFSNRHAALGGSHEGWVDGMPNATTNDIEFKVLGPGTLTIYTLDLGGTGTTWNLFSGAADPARDNWPNGPWTLIDTYPTGTPVTVTFSDPDCTVPHGLVMTATTAGSGFIGFDGALWTPAT